MSFIRSRFDLTEMYIWFVKCKSYAIFSFVPKIWRFSAYSDTKLELKCLALIFEFDIQEFDRV